MQLFIKYKFADVHGLLMMLAISTYCLSRLLREGHPPIQLHSTPAHAMVKSSMQLAFNKCLGAPVELLKGSLFGSRPLRDCMPDVSASKVLNTAIHADSVLVIRPYFFTHRLVPRCLFLITHRPICKKCHNSGQKYPMVIDLACGGCDPVPLSVSIREILSFVPTPQ